MLLSEGAALSIPYRLGDIAHHFGKKYWGYLNDELHFDPRQKDVKII